MAGQLHLPLSTEKDNPATMEVAGLAPARGTSTQQPQARAGQLIVHSQFSHRLSGHRKALSSSALASPHNHIKVQVLVQAASLKQNQWHALGASQHTEHY